MLNNIKLILGFIGAVFSGILGTWFIAKKKGRQEVIKENMDETIHNVEKIKHATDQVDNINNNDVITELRKYTKNN